MSANTSPGALSDSMTAYCRAVAACRIDERHVAVTGVALVQAGRSEHRRIRCERVAGGRDTVFDVLRDQRVTEARHQCRDVLSAGEPKEVELDGDAVLSQRDEPLVRCLLRTPIFAAASNTTWGSGVGIEPSGVHGSSDSRGHGRWCGESRGVQRRSDLVGATHEVERLDVLQADLCRIARASRRPRRLRPKGSPPSARRSPTKSEVSKTTVAFARISTPTGGSHRSRRRGLNHVESG